MKSIKCPRCNNVHAIGRFNDDLENYQCLFCYTEFNEDDIEILTFASKDLYSNSKILLKLVNFSENHLQLNSRRAPFLMISLSFVFFIILWTVASYFEGTLYLENNNVDCIGWFEDYVWFSMTLFFYAFFIMNFNLFDVFVKTFSKNGTILPILKWKSKNDSKSGITNENYNKLVRKQIQYINCANSNLEKLIIVSSLLSLFYSGIYLQHLKLPPVDIWHLGHYPIGWMTWFIANFFILVIFFPPLLSRFLKLLFSIFKLTSISEPDINNEMKSLPLNPNLLSPDGVAGMKPLGNLAFSFYLVGFTTMISIITWLLVREFSSMFFFTVPFGLLLIFITLFFPLYNVHLVMKKAKHHQLKVIANEFKLYYKLLIDRIESDVETFDEKMVKRVESMEQLDFVYVKCKKVPEWPLDTELIRKILTTLIPLLLVFINAM